MKDKIIPFGKYRGQPVEVLLADDKYTQWLQAQAWFAERFKDLAVAIANGSKAEETPDHNAMQARFLDKGLQRRIALRVHWNSEQEYDQKVKAVLAANPKATQSEEWLRTAFEVGGWDVVIKMQSKGVVVITPVLARATEWGFVGPCFKEQETDIALFIDVTLSIELKPTLSDDYPKVLREICARRVEHGEPRWLIADQYTGIGATWQQVKEIFASRGITAFLWSEL